MFDMILPTPNRAFEWRSTPEGTALVCRPLEALAPHCFTTREWALGTRIPDTVGSTAWSQLARAMGVDAAHLVRMQQVHGAAMAVADASVDPPVADILVTCDPSIAVAVQAADCVPLLAADRRSGAVGVAHAGWRGLAARVPAALVTAMAEQWGSQAADLIVATGPSIGACCYEVGDDVRVVFERGGFPAADLARWFLGAPVPTLENPSLIGVPTPARQGHAYFDGWRSVRDQLMGAGVSAERIFQAALCTASHPGTLCSYRRDGPPAGRIAGAIRSAARLAYDAGGVASATGAGTK